MLSDFIQYLFTKDFVVIWQVSQLSDRCFIITSLEVSILIGELAAHLQGSQLMHPTAKRSVGERDTCMFVSVPRPRTQ